MNIKFYGHNCFLLEGSKISLLIDPWLSEKGAFFGSWFQWPINHHLKNQLLEKLRQNLNNYLYISHEHQDHFDKETLEIIKPMIKSCIIPNYHDPFLFNQMKSLGYDVISLKENLKHYFNDKDYMELMIVDTGVNHDSAAIINLENKIFVNQNDCKIFDRLPYLADKKVDYYAVQFSGANWHPVCYEMSDLERKKISQKKVLSKLVAVRNAIKQIKPRYYIPSAGPAIFPFLKNELSLGVDNIFVHQPDIKNFLINSNTEVICPRPGDDINNTINYEPIEPPNKNDLDNLKKELKCEFYEFDDKSFDTENLIKEINDRLDQIKDLKFSECPKLIFDWNDDGLEIDLNTCNVNPINIKKYNWPINFMRIKASPAYFNLMSNPQNRWQDIYLTLRAKVNRSPDIFNTFINIFLFSNKENIRSGFETTLNINDERILVVNPNNGKNYEINRYCPHNGADLKNAKIDQNGRLICPRHAWAFDLGQDGVCKSAQATINAKEIVETTSLCEMASVRLTKN